MTDPGIKPIGTQINRGISAVLYSDPGIGKTTCIARLPVGETLIVNVEAGLGPLLGTGHQVFELKRDLRDIAKIYKFLYTEKHPFRYVVIDNISELQEWMVLSLTAMRKKEFAEVREKGDTASKMREYLYNFRNLIDIGICVIFNAWEMSLIVEKSSDGDKTKLMPKLYKSLTGEACGIVDLVGHLERYDKTEDRFIRFHGSDRIMAKSQFRGVNKFEPADFEILFKKIRKFNYAKAKPVVAITEDEVNLIKNQKGD